MLIDGLVSEYLIRCLYMSDGEPGFPQMFFRCWAMLVGFFRFLNGFDGLYYYKNLCAASLLGDSFRDQYDSLQWQILGEVAQQRRTDATPDYFSEHAPRSGLTEAHAHGGCRCKSRRRRRCCDVCWRAPLLVLLDLLTCSVDQCCYALVLW